MAEERPKPTEPEVIDPDSLDFETGSSLGRKAAGAAARSAPGDGGLDPDSLDAGIGVAFGRRKAARADGQPWPAADANVPAQLVAPTGSQGPLFLLFPNHFAIRKYNNSLAYALSVGLLADRMSGKAGVSRPWPQEAPLSLVDRMTAQRALAALGFDPGAPDGLIGLKTRQALRSWQKARGLVADGYLSPAMVQRLRGEAGAA